MISLKAIGKCDSNFSSCLFQICDASSHQRCQIYNSLLVMIDVCQCKGYAKQKQPGAIIKGAAKQNMRTPKITLATVWLKLYKLPFAKMDSSFCII